MWALKHFKKSPPPSPEYDKPWRPMDWKTNRQTFMATINDFESGNKDIDTLRVLLHGPQGAGKSSFFNSVNTALEGRITTRALAQSAFTGRSFTLECNTYKIKKKAGSFYPFSFTDIAGIHDDSSTSIRTEDIRKLLSGHIKDGYTFNSAKTIDEDDQKYNRNPALKDRIHCLVGVLPASTVSLMDGEVIKQMKAVREKARDLGIPQTVIITKVDEACPLVHEDLKKIYTSKKIKEKMEACSYTLGVPISCIYPVKNYHRERATDATMDVLILDALQNIVNFASDYVEDQVSSG